MDFQLIALITGFLVQFAALIWRISKAESRIYDRISTVEHETDLELERLRKEIVEFKLTISEAYLKKDSFTNLVDKIDDRLNRFENKLDAVISKQSNT